MEKFTILIFALFYNTFLTFGFPIFNENSSGETIRYNLHPTILGDNWRSQDNKNQEFRWVNLRPTETEIFRGGDQSNNEFNNYSPKWIPLRATIMDNAEVRSSNWIDLKPTILNQAPDLKNLVTLRSSVIENHEPLRNLYPLRSSIIENAEPFNNLVTLRSSVMENYRPLRKLLPLRSTEYENASPLRNFYPLRATVMENDQRIGQNWIPLRATVLN